MDDHCLTPHGTTPLQYISDSSVGTLYWTCSYCHDAFIALLKRGATEVMCYKFSLEFSQEQGIVAWADKVIYKKFSRPGMQEGDFWKIHLGCCIQLEPSDLNGSKFLQDLLEDVLIHPMLSALRKHIEHYCETVEESPGIWVTWPMGNTNPQHDNDDGSWRTNSDHFEEAVLLAQHTDEALQWPHNNAEDLLVILLN